MSNRVTRSGMAAAIAATVAFGACSSGDRADTTAAVTAPLITVATTAPVDDGTSRPAATVPPSSSNTAAPPTPPEDVLRAFLAEVEVGSVSTAMELLDPAGRWSLGFAELRLDEPVPAEFAGLVAEIGLPASATGGDVLATWLELQTATGAAWPNLACTLADREVECTAVQENRLTAIFGTSAPDTFLATVDASGLVTELFVGLAEPAAGLDDSFVRWLRVEAPDAAAAPVDPDDVVMLVEAAEVWDAGGRPDVPGPDPDTEPIDVVEAYVTARNDGDWVRHTAHLGGEALRQRFGSRDEFLAALALERSVGLSDCEVTLVAAAETAVACLARVDDIVTAAAGSSATNPNATTFGVAGGRVVRLPVFLPSLFRAEQAIEQWATATLPEAYGAACPDGIAGQDVIVGLSCAEFIAEHRDSWAGVVGAG